MAGEPEAALPYLRDAVRIQPQQPVALNTLGSALIASGKDDEAIDYFQQALKAQPTYTNARYNLANARAEQGLFSEAVEDFEQILKDNPDDAKAREHLFEVLKSLATQLAKDGRLTDSEKRMRQALAIHDDDVELHNNLGIMLVRAGDRAGAKEEFKTALKLDPTNEAARRNLSIATNGVSR